MSDEAEAEAVADAEPEIAGPDEEAEADAEPDAAEPDAEPVDAEPDAAEPDAEPVNAEPEEADPDAEPEEAEPDAEPVEAEPDAAAAADEAELDADADEAEPEADPVNAASEDAEPDAVADATEPDAVAEAVSAVPPVLEPSPVEFTIVVWLYDSLCAATCGTILASTGRSQTGTAVRMAAVLAGWKDGICFVNLAVSQSECLPRVGFSVWCSGRCRMQMN